MSRVYTTTDRAERLAVSDVEVAFSLDQAEARRLFGVLINTDSEADKSEPLRLRVVRETDQVTASFSISRTRRTGCPATGGSDLRSPSRVTTRPSRSWQSRDDLCSRQLGRARTGQRGRRPAVLVRLPSRLRHPDDLSTLGWGTSAGEEREALTKQWYRHRFWSRLGLGLMIAGFALQIASNLLGVPAVLVLPAVTRPAW